MSEELPTKPESHLTKPRAAQSRRRRLLNAIKLPAVSGWTTGALLFVCFLVSGLLIPVTLHLPKWIEAEIVLGVWWFIWLVALTWLLYTRSLVGAVEPHEPRSPFGYGFYRSDWNPGCSDPSGCLLAGEGWCLIGVLLIVVLPAAIWILVEVAIPALALILFGTIRAMLACVVNDQHRCQQHFGRSLGWAALWATVYVAPLALLVWWIHWQASSPGR